MFPVAEIWTALLTHCISVTSDLHSDRKCQSPVTPQQHCIKRDWVLNSENIWLFVSWIDPNTSKWPRLKRAVKRSIFPPDEAVFVLVQAGSHSVTCHKAARLCLTEMKELYGDPVRITRMVQLYLCDSKDNGSFSLSVFTANIRRQRHWWLHELSVGNDMAYHRSDSLHYVFSISENLNKHAKAYVCSLHPWKNGLW